MQNKQIVIVGGGAAGYFFANNLLDQVENCSLIILEQGKDVLQKVKVSGGGRCNVTNALEVPEDLIKNYPRGGQELLGPFHHFGTKETKQWFIDRGVQLKTEVDGRVFPKSNQSQTIIDCLRQVESNSTIQLKTQAKVLFVSPINNGKEGFDIHLASEEIIHADILMISSGSSQMMWSQIAELGIEIIDPVPSLFTFKIQDKRINELSGVSLEHAEVSAPKYGLNQSGPLLFTHTGLSGPAILKLSAFGARAFFECNYQFDLILNCLPELSLADLKKLRDQEGKKLINQTKFELPKRLQQSLLESSGVDLTTKWASTSNAQLEAIFNSLCQVKLQVLGQNKFKEEFVTAGGIDLKEVDTKEFSSKQYANLYFAGEVLNIDAVTGGFNFQAAWTTSYLAAQAVGRKVQ